MVKLCEADDCKERAVAIYNGKRMCVWHAQSAYFDDMRVVMAQMKRNEPPQKLTPPQRLR